MLLAVFGAITFRYLERRGAVIWLVVGLIWVIGLITSGFLVANRALLGQPNWLLQAFNSPVDIPSLIAIGGFAVIGLVALILAFGAFAAAHLPEIANRALFWIVVILLVMMGAAFGVSGNETPKQIGWLVQFVGLSAALSGAIAHRVFDVRRASRLAVGSALVTIVTAAMILAALLVAHGLDPVAEGGLLLMALLAVAVAILYVPVRAVMQRVVSRLMGSAPEEPVQVARRYSQDIAGVVELDELIDVAMSTLRDALRVRRGGLLLATRDDDDTIRIETMHHGMGDIPEVTGWNSEKRQRLPDALRSARDAAPVRPGIQPRLCGCRPRTQIVFQAVMDGRLCAGNRSGTVERYFGRRAKSER